MPLIAIFKAVGRIFADKLLPTIDTITVTIIAVCLPTIRAMKLIMAILAIAILIPLSACGGGGGSSMTPSGSIPVASSARTLADLNTYNTPRALMANEIREGGDARNVGDITGFRYNGADGNPAILVEKLDFAHLGIWINGSAFANNFHFANLDENVVIPPSQNSGRGTAIYAIEAEAVYNGIRFFPDGELTVSFDSAGWAGFLSADANDAADDFGNLRQVSSSDRIRMTIINGVIDQNGFHSPTGWRVAPVTSGIFRNFGITGTLGSTFRGRFSDDTSSYNSSTAAPRELSGIFGGAIDNSGNEMRGGFLGQCFTNCR